MGEKGGVPYKSREIIISHEIEKTRRKIHARTPYMVDNNFKELSLTTFRSQLI